MCLGIPGRVVETYREHEVLMGKVEFGGVSKRVCLEHVPDVLVNDYVLVHVGFALSRIDPDEARRVFEFLDAMNQLDELGPTGREGPGRASGPGPPVSLSASG
jgi:hydrogenase expression/formation protein HypC